MYFRFGASKIEITHAQPPELMAEVAKALTAGEGFALATLNLDHLVKLQADPAFRRAYAAQNMVVADGNPIVWLARLARQRISLMPGSDLVVPLCQLATAAGRPVSLFGATEAALAEASQALTTRIKGYRPGLLIAPPMGFDPEGPAARDALQRMAALGPQLCLIALGAPKQERFAALGRQLAPEIGFASVGAGVEFLSGHQRRAPVWMRALALEWLWRALSAPRRLIPRYLACFAILPAQAIAAWKQR